MLLLCAVISVLASSAQDIITKTDGSTLQVKVAEIGETAIKYHRFDNLNGPIYTIPISSIQKITYENGTEDTFNMPSRNLSQNLHASDADLLKMDLADKFNQPSYYYDKARRFKKIAKIGGVSIAATGIAAGICAGYACHEDGYFFIIAPSAIGLAAIWYSAFTIAANHQIKKARKAEMYSYSIMQQEIMRFGDISLNAGISHMQHDLSHTNTYGLGLSLNF